MGLLYKDLLELNKLYTDKVGGVQEVSEDENKGYVVTAADKKGNTPAWQGYKAGKKKKDGKPMYRAADHLKEEEVEVDESIGSAIDKGLSAGADVAKTAGKAAAGGVKVASKVVKGTAKAAGRVAGTAVGAVKSVKKGYQSGADANESYEVDESIGSAIDKGLGAVGDTAKVAGKAAVGGVKVASKVVKGTAKAAGRVAGTAVGAVKSVKKGFKSGADENESFEISAEVERLIESGLFSEEEISLLVWNEFDEGYQRDPEKGEAEARKADKRSAKEKRMADPEKGINSPAFREFMRSRGM